MRTISAPKLLAAIILGMFLAFTHYNPVSQSLPGQSGTAPITGRQAIYADPSTSWRVSKANVAKIDQQYEVAEAALPEKADQAAVDSNIRTAQNSAALEAESSFQEQAAGKAAAEVSPQLQQFRETVLDGAAGVVRGVYVDGVLALPVVQQPENENAFVSTDLGFATQFRSAEKNGVIGLLAHNYLSGDLFYGLDIGQEVSVIYGDGTTAHYRIESINQYQKLTPSNLRSDMIDLSTGLKVTTDEVFTKFYRGEHKLTFQTCLERNGRSNWGLTFVVAVPAAQSAQ